MRPLGRCGRRRLKIGRTSYLNWSHSQCHDEAFINLKRWMKTIIKSTGWTLCQKLQSCDFPDTGRGMRAASRFKSGDCIVSIPLDLLITTSTVLDSIGQEMKRNHVVFTPQQVLTVYLAIESAKGCRSEWSAYINTLPKTYTTPLHFSAQEVKMLSGNTRELAEALRSRFQSACKEIVPFINEAFPSFSTAVTESVLKWAWSTVDTRSVFLESKPHYLLNLIPEESNVALAPFLDMLNHSDTAQITAGLNSCTNCYEIRTDTPYNRYDQVFISYGSHDNTKLLVNYGFTLPNNVNNFYRVSMGDIKTFFPKIEHWERKEIILKDSELLKSLVFTMEGPSWSLMTALKIIALSWDQLSLWKKLLQGISLGDEIEMAATTMVHTLAKEALWKSRRQEKLVRDHPPSVHQGLILSLAEDEVHILEKSLHLTAINK